MPIVDVQVVIAEGTSIPDGTAKSLADTLATVLALPPGRVWVRLALLPASLYGENGEGASVLPVFLRILLVYPIPGNRSRRGNLLEASARTGPR
jgi:hypothetical protein